MTTPATTYTHALTSDQAKRLRLLLGERGYTLREAPYALFAAAKGKVQLTVYEKGPKIVVQGKETSDFVRFILEPEILGAAELDYIEVQHPEYFEPHIGVDESGKGDFFGPLVIAGVYTDSTVTPLLLEAGVQDSKRIGSDTRIREIAKLIKCVPNLRSIVIKISPERYNVLHAKFGNLNRLLAWGHARTIENLLEAVPACPKALSDQFANPRVLERALMEKGARITLVQRTKAEADPGVAAASILAREAYVDWIARASERLGKTIPKGAGPAVKTFARELVTERGADFLALCAKTHFRTAHEVAPEHFAAPPPPPSGRGAQIAEEIGRINRQNWLNFREFVALSRSASELLPNFTIWILVSR